MGVAPYFHGERMDSLKNSDSVTAMVEKSDSIVYYYVYMYMYLHMYKNASAGTNKM